MMQHLTMAATIAIALAGLAPSATAGGLVFPFAGSELVGEYRTEFDQFHYLDGEDARVLEGRIESRLFTKPAEKSTLEVLRSYEKELAANGFVIVTSIADDRGGLKAFNHEFNRSGGNRMAKRAYTNAGKPISTSTADWLVNFPERYLVAQKSTDAATLLVTVFISSKRDLYALDVVEAAAMEANTVSLNLDALRSGIATDGRIAIYDILFDTGSANIRPKSESALDVIAEYVRENPSQRFYMVGHTDDEGDLSANMRLSLARAEATVNALKAKAPGSDARLVAQGVGPLSPVATNAQTDGRQRNRRVELVLRLH